MSQKIGPREIALRAMREAKHRKVPAVRQTTPEASAPVKPKETTMKKPRAAKTAKKTAKKAPAGKQGKAPVSAKPPGKGKAPAAPKDAQAGSAGGKTISEIAREQILSGADNATALEAVKEAHPNGATNIGNIGWYRNDLRKKGLLPPKVEAA